MCLNGLHYPKWEETQVFWGNHGRGLFNGHSPVAKYHEVIPHDWIGLIYICLYIDINLYI